MIFFEDLPNNTLYSIDLDKKRKEEDTRKKSDKTREVKRTLVKSSTILKERSTTIKEEVLDWLLSFSTPMSKKVFVEEIKKLSADDTVALKQLTTSKGYRKISEVYRAEMPEYEMIKGEIYNVLIDNNIIALTGGNSAREYVEELGRELDVPILDVDRLTLESPNINTNQRIQEILYRANKEDILLIIGLERVIALSFYLKSSLISLLYSRKKEKDRYTILSWNDSNDRNITNVKEVAGIYRLK